MNEKHVGIIEQISSSIKAQDFCMIRQHAKELKHLPQGTSANTRLLQEVVEYCPDEAGAELVLLLVLAGVVAGGDDGDAALEVALQRHLPHTLQALLQCGAVPPDTLPGQCPEQLAELVDLFQPGLWTAVAEERLGDVRRLLNLWCLTDLCQSGQTLRQLALGTGNESIISLILNIEPSMRCAFLVLARDEDGLTELLASPAGKKVNPNFRKQSERGAPLLYFAAWSGSAAICQLLMEKGATIGLHMRDDDGADVPLIFALLHPSISPDVIRCILPPGVGEDGCSSPAGRQGRQLLQAACYRCCNVLTHAVEAGLTSEVFCCLLQAAGPELVCERGTDNLCLPERLSGRPALLELLRAALLGWIDGGAPRHRLIPLLVGGCDWLERLLLPSGPDPPAAAAGGGSDASSAAGGGPGAARVAEFLRERRTVQGRVDALSSCLRQESHSQEEFDRLADQLSDEWLWHARPSGDGTPLLVLAALFSRPAAVTRLSRGLSAPDTVRDGFRRTALHYACGTGSQPVRKALLKVGGTEHTLDVKGREPLDFGDVLGSERLTELLRMRRDREYGRTEPDPWEPDHRRQLQEGRRRQRFLDPALTRHPHSHSHSHSHSHGGTAALFPTAPGSDFSWPLPPDYSRASFAAAAPGGATGGGSTATDSSSCTVS